MIAGATLAFALAAVQGSSPFPCPAERLEPVREFSGIYVDEFEGQSFFEGASHLNREAHLSAPRTWIEIDLIGLGNRFGVARRLPGAAYRIRFVGERRSREVDRFPCGYGHLAASQARIDVVRLIEIERLPPQP